MWSDPTLIFIDLLGMTVKSNMLWKHNPPRSRPRSALLSRFEAIDIDSIVLSTSIKPTKKTIRQSTEIWYAALVPFEENRKCSCRCISIGSGRKELGLEMGVMWKLHGVGGKVPAIRMGNLSASGKSLVIYRRCNTHTNIGIFHISKKLELEVPK